MGASAQPSSPTQANVLPADCREPVTNTKTSQTAGKRSLLYKLFYPDSKAKLNVAKTDSKAKLKPGH